MWPYQAEGWTAAGTPLWIIAVAVGLYILLSLRSGAFAISSSARLKRESHPLLFWALVGATAALEAALVWGGWVLTTHFRPHFTVI